MTELLCNHETIFSSILTMKEKCERLAPICAEDQEIFNFFKPYLCTFNQNLFITIPLILLIIIILFKFICTAVEEYIAPAIVYLSEFLGLSESLAGVTLIAFANGAGDVLTAIVASDSKEGISYNIGSLYGAGLFVLTIVVALTIKNSPEKIIVDKSTIYRDIGFYILATIITIIFAVVGKITWWSSVILLLLYLSLVVCVIVQDCFAKKKNNIVNSNPEKIDENDNKEDEENLILTKFILKKKIDHHNLNLETIKKAITMTYEKIIKNKKHIREEDGESYFVKIIDLLDFPFHWLRKLTIPPCNDEDYNHIYTIIWPFLGISFLLYNFIKTPYMIYIYALPGSACLSFLFWKFPNPSGKLPRYYIILDLLGILCSVLWTKMVCGLLVDLLSFVGVLTNLSSTYLGLTIIAVGNALPDGLTTIAIAKKGQAVMGLTGGIVGQLFGLLVGFGVSMLKKSLLEGEQVFDLFNREKLSENLLDLIVIGFGLLTMLFIFGYGIWNNFLFDKKMSVILLIIYGVFFLTTTLYAFLSALSLI